MASRLFIKGEFFFNLESTILAASSAVSDVVAIRSDFPSDGLRRPFSLMYYDTEDRGPQIMRRRLLAAPKDITYAIDIHSALLSSFYEASIDLIQTDRTSLLRDVEETISLMSEYTGLVLEHQKNLKDEFFLYLPTSVSGHHEVFGTQIRELSFNPYQTEEGGIQALEDLKKSTIAFIKSNAFHNRSYLEGVRAKITEYRQKHETTRLLIRDIDKK